MNSLKYLITILAILLAVAIINADELPPISSAIQKLFDETSLPCTPHDVVNHTCYFCKCNVHGNRQHCVYTCNPTTGRPVKPGSKICTAQDEFKQGCKRCRCSKGHLFYDCFISNHCSGREGISAEGDL